MWIYEGGRWLLYKEVMKKPLCEEYLTIGTRLALGLRKLPHSANSQLRYQVHFTLHKINSFRHQPQLRYQVLYTSPFTN